MPPHTRTVIPDSEEEEEGSDVGGEQPSPVQHDERPPRQPQRQGLRRRLDLEQQPQRSDSVVLDEDTTKRRAAVRAAKGKQPAARQAASSVKREAAADAASDDDDAQQQPVTAQDMAALQAELESNPRLARQLASGEGPSSSTHQWRVRVYEAMHQQQSRQARQQQAAGSKRRREDPAAAAAAAGGGDDSSDGGGRQPPRATAAAAAAAGGGGAGGGGAGTAAAASTQDRRRLRQQLRGLEAEATHQAEVLRDASSNKLMRMLMDVEALGGMATAPREQAQTAGVLAVLTGNGLAMMQRFANSAQGRNPTDLVNALRQAYGHSHATCGVDFAQVGSDASHLFKRAAGLGNMLGPLAAAPKVRAAPQRRARQAPAVEMAPVEGPAALQKQHGQAQETDHVVQDMRVVLSEVGTCRVVHLVLDHDSFAATMEHVFALSFLVKDMWVRLEVHERDGLLAHHVAKRERAQLEAASAAASAAAAPAAAGRQHQFMMTWTMAMWRDLCRVVRRSETLMPPRPA